MAGSSVEFTDKFLKTTDKICKNLKTLSVFVKESYFHPSFYRQLSVVLRKCEFKFSKFLQIKSIIEFVKKYRWSKTGFWTQTKSVVSIGKTFVVRLEPFHKYLTGVDQFFAISEP